MLSITHRLTLSLGVGVMVVMVLLFLLGSHALQQLLQEQIASRLQHDAEALLSALVVSSETISIDTEHIDGTYQRPFSGHYYMVESSSVANLYSRSLWDEMLQLPTPRNLTAIHRGIGPQRQPLLLLSRRYIKGDRPLLITVAEDISQIEAELLRLRSWYAAISVMIVVGLLLLLRLQLIRAMQPIHRARTQLQALNRGERKQLDEAVPVEIKALVCSMNHALKLLEQRNSRSRKALGNLAHALKTPLARIIQLTNHRLLEREQALQQSLLDSAQQIQNQISHELTRARIVGYSQPGGFVPWQETVEDLLTTLRQLYRQRDVEIKQQLTAGLQFAGDRQELMELLGNLLDNAFKWAQGQIQITLVEAQGIQRLTIADDGPGIPEEQWQQILKRGQRLDEGVQGHGLGLAIVHDIVTAYRGELSFGFSASLGGLEVVVRLPANEGQR